MFKNNGDNPDAQDQELIFTQAENKENKSINLNTFKYTNINLSKINYCIQNVDWEDYNILRDETIRNYEIHRQGNRNNPINFILHGKRYRHIGMQLEVGIIKIWIIPQTISLIK